jgi:hypothetical protein
MAICENVAISVCIILVGMWRSCSCLVVGVGIIPLIFVLMMMGPILVGSIVVVSGMFCEFFWQ